MVQRGRAAGRLRALTALAAGGALLLAACGGGGGNDEPQAEELVPDLEEFGLTVQQEGEVVEDANTYRAIFGADDGSNTGVLTDIRIMGNEGAAEAEFSRLAEALQNPPQEFLGAEADQESAEPVDAGDEQTAYVTAEPDNSGNRVWTDLYRAGTVVVITQTLGSDEDGVREVREEVAARVLSEVE